LRVILDNLKQEVLMEVRSQSSGSSTRTSEFAGLSLGQTAGQPPPPTAPPSAEAQAVTADILRRLSAVERALASGLVPHNTGGGLYPGPGIGTVPGPNTNAPSAMLVDA
jgi:hypothetical protein